MRNIQNSSEIALDTILDGRLMRTSTVISLTLIGALLVCLIGAFPAAAQQVTASITGQVTDPSGAAMAGQGYGDRHAARNSIHCPDEFRRRYTTFEHHSWHLQRQGGEPGFSDAHAVQHTLQLNQVAKLDFPLQVGNVATTVEVTSAAPVLQTESTQLGR